LSWLKIKGLETDETGYFTRRENIPKIGYSSLLSEVTFSLSSEKRYPDEVFEVNNNVYIIKWLTKEDINMKDFDKEKKSFQQTLLLTKDRRIFNAWLQSIKEKATIKIVTSIE